MTIDKIVVAILGFFGIAFTCWFFLMKKDSEVAVSESVDIIVEGGYSPSVISIPNARTTNISFIRKDPSSCLEEIVIPDFKIRKYLPMDQKISISLSPWKKGQFEMSCGMNMFHGKIIVR